MPRFGKDFKRYKKRWEGLKKFRKRNYLTIKAPVMYVDKSPVWMDRHWFPNFCDFLKANHFKIKGIDILNQKIKVRFTDPDHVIMFGLMYDRAKEEKIF